MELSRGKVYKVLYDAGLTKRVVKKEFIAKYLGLNSAHAITGEIDWSFRPKAGTSSIRTDTIISVIEMPEDTEMVLPRKPR
jgi:hypothetical protein